MEINFGFRNGVFVRNMVTFALEISLINKYNESLKDEELAAYYLLQSDKKACLGIRGAKWLLDYYRNGGKLQLTDQDIQRFRILAGEI